ncbi:MAG: ABC transporter permease [Chloroflexi bacterium]|nr:ABC transporter permease [Chloroflexota bacterium]
MLFGIGYQDESRTLRTLFVVPENSPMEEWIETYSEQFEGQLEFVGITHDADEADSRLRNQDVDLVIVVPKDPSEGINNNEQAVITLYHYEIDPYEQAYVRILGRIYTDKINEQVLMFVAEQGKVEAESLQEQTEVALSSVTMMREALEEGDTAAAESSQQELHNSVAFLRLATASSLAFLGAIEQTSESPLDGESQLVLTHLNRLQEKIDALRELDADTADFSAEIALTQEIEIELDEAATLLTDFQRVDSHILVSPFRSEVVSITNVTLQPIHFFVPAVISLLLQHMAVTIAALSLVRERRSGAMELFRASPVSAFETLTGKYISHFFLAGLLATVLTLLIIYVLKVPMLGDWGEYILILAALLFTSLGIGFNFSLSARTDSQAVQSSMVLLLASIFFAGFFLALHRFWWPVHIVSWSLPATYSTSLLQNAMLRGQGVSLILLLALTGIGILLFLWHGFGLNARWPQDKQGRMLRL